MPTMKAVSYTHLIVLLLMGQPARFGDWVYRALTFLVISCPCALVISIPLDVYKRQRITLSTTSSTAMATASRIREVNRLPFAPRKACAMPVIT